MNQLIYLVGLPASGKSTICDNYKKQGYKIFSSDAIREELYGDESNQSDPGKVFQILHKRIKEALRANEDCVYDATNLVSKRRIAFLKEIANIPCEKVCLLCWAPYEVCLERNRVRERTVPEYAMERMYKQFETPAMFEGWDRLACIFTALPKQAAQQEELLALDYFAQDNSHHKLTLGEHMTRAWEFVAHEQYCIREAARWHDLGKVKTKAFLDSKGRPSKEAHYYNHQNVGAYDYLGLNSAKKVDMLVSLEVSALICYHMHPYFWQNNPKMEQKYRRIWGEDFYNMICLIHKADVWAH